MQPFDCHCFNEPCFTSLGDEWCWRLTTEWLPNTRISRWRWNWIASCDAVNPLWLEWHFTIKVEFKLWACSVCLRYSEGRYFLSLIQGRLDHSPDGPSFRFNKQRTRIISMDQMSVNSLHIGLYLTVYSPSSACWIKNDSLKCLPL
jgi:hypothetical protein